MTNERIYFHVSSKSVVLYFGFVKVFFCFFFLLHYRAAVDPEMIPWEEWRVTRKISEGVEWSTCSTTTTTASSARVNGCGENSVANRTGRGAGSGIGGCEEDSRQRRRRGEGRGKGQDDDIDNDNDNDNVDDMDDVDYVDDVDDVVDNGWGGVRRLQAHRKKVQEMVVDCDRALLVLVHAHVSLRDTLASVRTASGECAAVILPCCNWYSKLLHPDGHTPPRAVGHGTLKG